MKAVTGISATRLLYSHASRDVPTTSDNTMLPVYSHTYDRSTEGACSAGQGGGWLSGGGGGGAAAVGGHGGASGGQQPVSQLVPLMSSHATVSTDLVDQHPSQQAPLASVNCELSPPYLGGGDRSSVVYGGSAAMTGALFVRNVPHRPAQPGEEGRAR